MGRFRQMEHLIEMRQIKAGDSDKLIVLDYAEWEKKNGDAQMKNLMWGYDRPKPEVLPY